jgi:SrtB family sortase
MSLDGEYATAGTIFIDGSNTPDFSDPNTIIYGHNMGDKTMFGKLKNYVNDPEYYENHQYFQIFTKDKIYRYQIFAYEQVQDDGDVYYMSGSNPMEYWSTLLNLIQDSYVEKRVPPQALEHMVTLSTCTTDKDKRLVICAARIDER